MGMPEPLNLREPGGRLRAPGCVDHAERASLLLLTTARAQNWSPLRVNRLAQQALAHALVLPVLEGRAVALPFRLDLLKV